MAGQSGGLVWLTARNLLRVVNGLLSFDNINTIDTKHCIHGHFQASQASTVPDRLVHAWHVQ